MDKPTCSEETALDQAGVTVSSYIATAIDIIDKHFGKGFAKSNPALVGEVVKAQAMDYNCTALSAALYEISNSVNELSSEVGDLKI